MFAESCLEYKLVKEIKDTAPLIEAVFLEYAHYWNSLSLLRGMKYYREKAGEKVFFNTCTETVLGLFHC